MAIHYSPDYHKTITAAGETSASSRWGAQRKLISRYKESGAILDIGCSSGAFLGTMKSPAWRLYGVEMEASTADRARAATGAEVFVGDVMDAPFEAGSLDVITCFDLLEHVYDPREFLAKAFEWLAPGGILCTVLPNIESWEARLFGSYWYGLELPRHLFHFSPGSLRRLMTSLGFRECLLKTNTSYVERSFGYVVSNLEEKFGVTPVPASRARPSSLPVRAIRKLLRLGLVRPFTWAASTAGAAGSIQAVFAKPSL